MILPASRDESFSCALKGSSWHAKWQSTSVDCLKNVKAIFETFHFVLNLWSASSIIWPAKWRSSGLHHRCVAQESPFPCDACKLFTLSNHP